MNAVINLNKPENISSQQAVTKIKRLLRVKKAGHTGTLDPLATGVLVVCLNEATKISRFLSDLDKEYIVRMNGQTPMILPEGSQRKSILFPFMIQIYCMSLGPLPD